MSEESPERDWEALLEPEKITIWEQRRRERALKAMRRRDRIWTVFTWIVIGVVFLIWLALFPWATRVPGPWNWLTWPAWILLFPSLLFVTVVILRWLERRVLPGPDQELLLES